MSGNELYPLTLEPIPAEQFQDRSGRPWPAGEVPEFSLGTLWLAADASRAAAGPQAGRGLGYLRHLWGADLVGLNAGGVPDSPLPVDLKLKNTGEAGQTLALTDYSLWYILAAEEESFLRAGFRPDSAEFEAEAGRCLFLPPDAPLVLGPGLTLAQFGPPARPIPPSPDAMADPPVWLSPVSAGPGEAVFFQDERLTVRLITTTHWSSLTAPEALTCLWPRAGQGRILTLGPAPTTRLKPGRAVLLPAALGRYAVESVGKVSYLLIESR
jgi:hypothetical protein